MIPVTVLLMDRAVKESDHGQRLRDEIGCASTREGATVRVWAADLRAILADLDAARAECERLRGVLRELNEQEPRT